MSERCREIPAWQKWAFAVAAVAVLIGALAAQVENERHNYAPRPKAGTPVRVVDLDFMAVVDTGGASAFYSVGPLGQTVVGQSPLAEFISYRSGDAFAVLTPAGSSYSGLEWWRGGVGAEPPTSDGVHARYENLFPSTAADVVSGIDGVEFTLELRSRPFVGTGDLRYEFWLDTSQGLYPARATGPLLTATTTRATVSGPIPLKNGAGQTVFTITPASALVDFRGAPRPANDRSVALVDLYFPSHEDGERAVVPLDYVVERVDERIRLSVVVPVEMFFDPAIEWPIRIDPGITNPIANSSYFADETILMDSDLVVTSSGAAQFSNVTLIMNRTAAPNYQVEVNPGGRMTLLRSTIQSNSSARPYRLLANGTFTAQDALIKHAADGLQLRGDGSTLNNVTISNGTGRGLVLEGVNATMSGVTIPYPEGTGLYAQRADFQASFVNITHAGREGLYLNATSGNFTHGSVLNATMNGAMIVNGSRINVTLSEFANSGRNGVFGIGGAPSLENSSVTGNNWSGVSMMDDHSGFIYGNWIAENNWSGVEARLNSTVDVLYNIIENNGQAGVRGVAADPNVEMNTIRGNEVGVWLEGAHNGDAKPGAPAGAEANYPSLMSAAADVMPLSEPTPLTVGVDIVAVGPDTLGADVDYPAVFEIDVTDWTLPPGSSTFDLSVDGDTESWAVLSDSSVAPGYGNTATIFLTVSPTGTLFYGEYYNLKVNVVKTDPGFDSNDLNLHVRWMRHTDIEVEDVYAANQSVVIFTAQLFAPNDPDAVGGRWLAFRLDGHWIGEGQTDEDGYATVGSPVVRPPSHQLLEVFFNGTEDVMASYGSSTVFVDWSNTTLEAFETEARWGDTLALKVMLTGDIGPWLLYSRWIYFSIDDVFVGVAPTDMSGAATLLVPNLYEIGTYAWNASFDGDEWSSPSGDSSTFDSLREITVGHIESFTIRQGETAAFHFQLTDDEGLALDDAVLTLKRGPSLVVNDLHTDSSGWLTYSDTGAAALSEGNYTFNFTYSTTDHFVSMFIQRTLTVRRWSTEMYPVATTSPWGDPAPLRAQLRDEDGNNLSGKTVSVYVDGQFIGDTTTNATGWANIDDTTVREIGEHLTAFRFAGDGRNFGINRTGNLTVVRESTMILALVDARVTLGKTLTIQIRLMEDDGPPVVGLVNVTLFGGAFAAGTTDVNGFLNVSFDSAGRLPGRYVLWYSFDGDAHRAGSAAYTRIVVDHVSNLFGNLIENNGFGIRANNSSSVIWSNALWGNARALNVTSGRLQIFNSTVSGSSIHDFEVGKGGWLFSTNTTFNRGKVAFASDAYWLNVSWFLGLRVLDPRPLGAPGAGAYTLAVLNNTGVSVYGATHTAVLLNAPESAAGGLPDCGEPSAICPLVTIVEYTQNSSGIFARTAHRVSVDNQTLTVVMDATKRLTLYLGNDSDWDGIPNIEEDATDVYWYEAEGHVFGHTQFVKDANASQGTAVSPVAGDGRLTDNASFSPVLGGSYVLLFRANAGVAGAEIRVIVAAANGSVLLNISYAQQTAYRWFTTPLFSFSGNQSLRVNLSDASGGLTGASLRLDELALARIFNETDARTHWLGQITDPYDGDQDFDRGLDGAERRNGSVWYEVENLVPDAGGRRVPSLGASNAWAARHPAGNLTIASLNETALPLPGVYAAWIRAMGDGAEGILHVKAWIGEALAREENLSFPDGEFAFQQFRFEWPSGGHVRFELLDGADASGGKDAPVTLVDKVGLVLELARPSVVMSEVPSESLFPATYTTPVFVEKTVVRDVNGYDETSKAALLSNTAMLYWVADDHLYGMPFATLEAGAEVTATWSYEVGANPTQPVTFALDNGSKMLATTAGGQVYLFALPILPGVAPITFSTSADWTTPLAYANEWLVYATSAGGLSAIKISAVNFGQRFNLSSGTVGLGLPTTAPTIHEQTAYFGFQKGIQAIAVHAGGAATILWKRGDGQWFDARDHCPGFHDPGSPCAAEGTYAMTNRAVRATPLVDNGNVYVLAVNATEADLVRLSEGGQPIWVIDLEWPESMMGAASGIIQLALRNGAVVVNGPVLRAVDRETGALLMGHDFGLVDPEETGGSPVLTDREMLVPGPGGLYFFAYPADHEFGDALPEDGDHTFGASAPEDILWVMEDAGRPRGQVLVGDFDGSGMRDAIFAGVNGEDQQVFAFLKGFEFGHRNLLEYTQLGKDAAHSANAEYLQKAVPTDPLDPDMDFDGLSDAYEVAGFFGWKRIEAEDATNFTAWAHDPANGGPKNYNFFHQSGVTLTSDDGSIMEDVALRSSMIQFRMTAEGSHTYRVKLVSNESVANIVDLRFESGNSAEAVEDPDTSEGLGLGADLSGRIVEATELPVSLNEGQQERIRQMVEEAVYMKVSYPSLDPWGIDNGTFTTFGAKHDTEVTVYKAVWAGGTGGGLWVSVFVSMDIDFELLGGTAEAPWTYVFEVGLDLSSVDQEALGGSALPADVTRLRIQDLDRLDVARRGLDAFVPDTDGDAVPDGAEATAFPLNADPDEDGISDFYEVTEYGTDPGSKDTDGDGIRDRVELGLTGDTDPYTTWDTEESLASYPEYLAARFRGDPFFELPTEMRTLSNNDQDPETTTDPKNPDSDGDGIPDGWMDGWIYDPSFMIGQVMHSTASTEYLSRAQPQNYDVKYWHQSGIYDNYAQIWEGEDANLDGAVTGNEASNDTKMHWSFWPSMTGEDGDGTDATLLSYVRRGWGETDPSDPDSDGDRIPEGYEVWYTTRAPIYSDTELETLYFTPVANDSGLDVDTAYGSLRIDHQPASANNAYKQVVGAGTGAYVAHAAGIPEPASPAVPLLATEVLLNLSSAATPTVVTVELWQGLHTTDTPQRFLVSASGSVKDTPDWVSFDIPDTWLNFASDHYYIALKNASSAVTWWDLASGSQNWSKQESAAPGNWYDNGSTNGTPGIRIIDAFSAAGDSLTNYEEYLLGSNPKRRDTDAGTSGPNSKFGDLLSDGAEMINHTIFRTNATLGGLVSTYYGASSWILFDKSLETSGSSDWMYFNWLEDVKDPNETFAGTKDKTSYLFTLQDGAELRMNVSASRLYMYLPGADFENLVNETDHANSSSHYAGEAHVFFQLNNSGAPADYKRNNIFGDWAVADPWLFFQKQFYASDPFDWDTDNDGLADGWEISPWHDTDGDFVPNVRDADSDNDGLTDGQEMLQVQWDWFGEVGTTAANLRFDPENDTLYPMVDSDSDGDGIPDAKEVLWSVDTDGDKRINLVDWDSDADGLCDGWCTSTSTAAWRVGEFYAGWNLSLPPGMPNGEDVNQNGTNEQGESSPVKYDTDQDGLWDGYAYNTNAAGWQLTEVVGARCNMTGNISSHCGEESSYSLYNGSFTSKTNRTSPDTDGDGLTDMFEVHGWPIRYLNGDFEAVNRYAISNPNRQDSEGDGLVDAVELLLGTNTTANDTDTDGIWDGVEDRNRDGVRQSNETSAIENDTDRDGLCDGNCGGVGEDLDKDGVKDANEPDPLLADTDGDKIVDGVEFALMRSEDAGWAVTHDFDGDGMTDLNDVDADDDGLNDGVEDHDRDATIDSALESNPYDDDTDDDGLYDGAEPAPFEDTDGDDDINIRDPNSNDGDGKNDDEQVWVVFRTNAMNGDYGDGTWVAVVTPRTNPAIPEGNGLHAAYDYSVEVALYVWGASTTTVSGSVLQNPYGPDPASYLSTVNLTTPEGYLVYWDAQGASVYLEVGPSQFVRYDKDDGEPGDWTENPHFEPAFLRNHQETYDGRDAINLDSDFDGITNAAEVACEMNPTSNDTDGDGILDGIEYHACQDFDNDDAPDADDTDADGDGIADQLEDKNKNGRLDAGETDRLGTDTDGDGLGDGTEDADHDGVLDAAETSPSDRDTDDDGIEDKAERDGSWCYVGQTGPCANAGGVLNPRSVDTDGDSLKDGEEIGLTSGGLDTLVSVFLGDADPSTVTNPNATDSDQDGITDGKEDLNHNGRVDSGEANPMLWDTDRDGLPDGRVNFAGTWKGEDLNNNGIRDKDANDEWNETDFLANDSDVDGVFDGAEKNGTYCFKNATSTTCTNPTLDPLNADFDGDGLRDGQELAGWIVGVWYERTMEKKENRSVTSYPWLVNSDADNLTDFNEFMNGSDPTALDTDGDGLNDSLEIARKSNITGIEGTPPEIENVSLQIGIEGVGVGLLYLPTGVHVTVSFDVKDNVGLGRLDVRFMRVGSSVTDHLEWARADAPTGYHYSHDFQFGILDALVSGADVNITAYDANENGAWTQFHIQSVLEAVVAAIAAFLSAIAKVIVEAASAILNFAMEMIEGVLSVILRPVADAFDSWLAQLSGVLSRVVPAGITKGGRPGGGNLGQDVYVGDIVSDYAMLNVVLLLVTVFSIIHIFLFAFALTPSPFAVVVGALAVTLLPALLFWVALRGVGFTSPPPAGSNTRQFDTELHYGSDAIIGGMMVRMWEDLSKGFLKLWKGIIDDEFALAIAFIGLLFWVFDSTTYYGALGATGSSPQGGYGDVVHKLCTLVMFGFSVVALSIAAMPDSVDKAAAAAGNPAARVEALWEEVFTMVDFSLSTWGFLRMGVGLEDL